VQSVSRFELSAALDLARAVLPTGAALLLVSDAFEHELCDDVRLLGIGVRYDATMLLARDPWQDGLPLHGFVRFRDLESGEILSRWIGAAERARYHEASEARELAIRRRFESAGWRVGMLDERDGKASLAGAFGLPQVALR